MLKPMTTQKPKHLPRASKPAQPAKRAASARGGQVAALIRLVELVERVAACQGGDTYFSKSELEGWPAELVQDLQRMKLLAQASPASSAECPGCEEACMMPVHVLHGPTAETTRALIVCESRDDISRVDVPISNLERLKSSGQMLAEALAKLLHMDLARPTQLDGARWQLGVFDGVKRKDTLMLVLGMEPSLVIAGHTVKLLDLLGFADGVVTLNQSALIHLADNPIDLPAGEKEDGEDRARRYRLLQARLKAAGVHDWQRQAAMQAGISLAGFKKLLKQYPGTADASLGPGWLRGLGNATKSGSLKKTKP